MKLVSVILTLSLLTFHDKKQYLLNEYLLPYVLEKFRQQLISWIPANYEETREEIVHMQILVNHIKTILYPSICDGSVAEIASDILPTLFKTVQIDAYTTAIHR